MTHEPQPVDMVDLHSILMNMTKLSQALDDMATRLTNAATAVRDHTVAGYTENLSLEDWAGLAKMLRGLGHNTVLTAEICESLAGTAGDTNGGIVGELPSSEHHD